MNNNYGIVAFAYSDKCENTLQKLILITLAGCPEPSGLDWVESSVKYLSEFCIATEKAIERQLKRLQVLGAIKKLHPPKVCEEGDIFFTWGGK